MQASRGAYPPPPPPSASFPDTTPAHLLKDLTVTPHAGERFVDLDLAGCQVTDATIAHVAVHCPNIVTLDVSGTTVSGLCFMDVAANCRRLRELTMRGCDGLRPAGLRDIAFYCSDLRGLRIDVSRCAQITNAVVDGLIGDFPSLVFVQKG